MNIFPVLSKNAWNVLFTLTDGPCQASEIAKKTGLRLNRVTESLNQLEKNGIIPARKRRAVITLDSWLKNVLKHLLTSYGKERLVGLLEGKKLTVLLQILNDYDTTKKLKLATDYSIPTLKRITKQLQDGLLIYQPKKGMYLVRDQLKSQITELCSSFMNYLSNSLEKQGIVWDELIVFGNKVLIRSKQESIQGFVKTGISRFHEYKVQLLLTDYNYFVNGERPQTMEETFIHALARAKDDYRNVLYCTLFADLNKLTLKQLDQLPVLFKVEKEARQIFEYLASKGKTKTMNDFLTPYAEYLEVRRDYARG